MSGKSKSKTSNLRQLRNIGRVMEERLLEVGIDSCRQLKKTGAAKAFEMIRDKHPEANLPVRQYLFSLQGALLNMHWDALPDRTKRRLLREAGQE